ncbi:MAG: hypothetical protein IIB38_15750 [Candidatus Hydrogenedentes bacterium]|nr:hypothetical protein [Candidatus Hydrogenedentota bacterium]
MKRTIIFLAAVGIFVAGCDSSPPTSTVDSDPTAAAKPGSPPGLSLASLKQPASVTLPDGSTQTWEKLEADEKGWLRSSAFRGGYAYASVESETERIMLLHASGQSVVYVNGEPRAGDPYSTGRVRLPVRLKAGRNDLLFHVSRGQLKATLVQPESSLSFNTSDLTLPDFLVDEKADFAGAIIVTNTTDEMLTTAGIETVGDGLTTTFVSLPSIPPPALTSSTTSFAPLMESKPQGRSGPSSFGRAIIRARIANKNTDNTPLRIGSARSAQSEVPKATVIALTLNKNASGEFWCQPSGPSNSTGVL